MSGRTTDLPFDVFLYDNAGTPTLEFLNWTNATTRATAVVQQDGVWCKSGSLDRRYLGSVRPRSATTYHWVRATADTPAKFDLYNADNQVRFGFSVRDTTNSWNYSTATIRQANGSTNNQVDLMVGLQKGCLSAQVNATSANSGASRQRSSGIGFDSTAALATGAVNTMVEGAAGDFMGTMAMIDHMPAVGRHFYAWLEYSETAATTTWYGDNGGAVIQSGMTGNWWC